LYVAGIELFAEMAERHGMSYDAYVDTIDGETLADYCNPFTEAERDEIIAFFKDREQMLRFLQKHEIMHLDYVEEICRISPEDADRAM